MHDKLGTLVTLVFLCTVFRARRVAVIGRRKEEEARRKGTERTKKRKKVQLGSRDWTKNMVTTSNIRQSPSLRVTRPKHAKIFTCAATRKMLQRRSLPRTILEMPRIQ